MPSRVLLVSLNRCSNPDPVFPIGLAYLNSSLRRAGHQVRWHDILAHDAPLDAVLKDYKPDLVGISLRNIDNVLLRRQEIYFRELEAVCSEIHNTAKCPVVLGGSGFSIFPEELLQFSGADFGISGAGELPLIRLLETLDNGRNFSSIPNLLYREGEKIRWNPPSPELPPLPLNEEDRPSTVVNYYLQANATLNVQTQRGCSFKCCYCTYPLLEGRVHLRRPPEEIAEEFAQAERAGARFIFVVDSVFNSSPRHVQEVCEAILRRNLKISWGCFLRPQGLTPEIMDLMKRAGLSHVEFGSDSFTDAVLKSYHKGLTFDGIRQSSELARQAQVEFCHFVICGGPGETPDTLEESYHNSKQLEGAVVMAVVGMRIYPGTPLFERARAENYLPQNTNLLEPVYYVSRNFGSPDEVFDKVRGFAKKSPNWIVGDPAPAFLTMVARLRKRGMVGPLWSYAAMVQRLWPGGWTGGA